MAILNTTTAKADNTETGERTASLDTPTRKLREKSGVTVSVIVKKAKDEPPATPTKTDIVLKKLKSAKGVTMQVLMDATGWQAHSVRGFLSGTIKKKLGHELLSETGKDGQRRYRIVEAKTAG
ncbi:DUF3489 domain-containing protein [Mesorhizobium australicum]|uniref:DUF3489 domain-containing protein n=1 Tax=Mesorhizobium australicum TaxID=536018 RepID=UPI00333C40AC